MPKAVAISQVDDLLRAGCARNVPAELHYEPANGALVAARVRLLELTKHHILADRPLLVGGEQTIPVGKSISVHVSVRGTRYKFPSAIESDRRRVRLNARQLVPGIALRRPATMSESQRRSHLRVSLASIEPINVDLARPHETSIDACSVDAGQISAWLLDLSVGGASLLVDRRVLDKVTAGERFHISFELPCMEIPFCMFATVRHSRTVERSDSLRIGVLFKPWPGSSFAMDQSRISQFVAAYERRMLRRRK